MFARVILLEGRARLIRWHSRRLSSLNLRLDLHLSRNGWSVLGKASSVLLLILLLLCIARLVLARSDAK